MSRLTFAKCSCSCPDVAAVCFGAVPNIISYSAVALFAATPTPARCMVGAAVWFGFAGRLAWARCLREFRVMFSSRLSCSPDRGPGMEWYTFCAYVPWCAFRYIGVVCALCLPIGVCFWVHTVYIL